MYFGYKPFYTPYLKMGPMELTSELYNGDEIGYDWNESDIHMKLSQSVIINDINFLTLEKILAALGGTLFVLKGVFFVLTVVIVKDKW